MATERIRTVKSSAGDYASLNAWEAGEQANIVSLDEIRIAECYAFSDTVSTTISGWTTDATRYIKVTVPSSERHAGVWNTSKYRLEVTNNFVLSFGEEYIRMEFVQVSISSDNSTSYQALRIAASIASGGSDIRLESCLIRQAAGSTGTGSLRGLSIDDVDATVKVSNCIAYDFTQGSGRGFIVDNSTQVYFFNCGAHNCDVGFGRSATTPIVINSWAQNCTDGFSTGFHADSDYNVSDLASDAPGANSKNSTNISFVDEANDDFHLASGDTAAKDSGTDLSGHANYPISTDIDGATRSGTWDIGPDEIVAAGGSATGSGTPSLSAITSSGSGVASHPGSGSPTLSVVTGAGSGIASHPGSGSPTLSGVTGAGAGIASHPGTGTPSLSAITASGSGVASHPGSGTPTLPAISAAGAGANGKSGTGAISLSAILASGSGVVAHLGSGALVIPALSLSGLGAIPVSGSGVLSIPALSLAGAGIAAHIAAGVALTLSSLTLSGTGSAGVEAVPLNKVLIQSLDVMSIQVTAANHLQIQIQSLPPLSIDLNHP